MVDHLEDAALEAQGVQREDAEHHEAEVAHRAVGDQALPVLLDESDKRSVNDPDDRESGDPPHRFAARLGQERNREPHEAVGPHLQQHPGQDDRTGGGRLDVGVRKPGVEREHRDLDGEPDEEGEEHPELETRRVGGLHQAEQVEGVLPGRPVVGEVERQDAEQHQDASHQRVEEELDGRVELPRAAPDPDQEVHRDQHHFPEHVEQEEVEGNEDPQHSRLEEQEEDVVLLDPLGDAFPGGQDGDEAEQGGHQDQQQADPVEAEVVFDADARDPLVALSELELRPGRVEREPERQRDQESDERRAVREPADPVLVGLLDEEQDEERRDRRKEDHQRQDREVEGVVLEHSAYPELAALVAVFIRAG